MKSTEAKQRADAACRIIDELKERVMEHALAQARAECDLEVLLASFAGKSSFHTRDIDGRIVRKLKEMLERDGYEVTGSNNGLVIRWDGRKP